MHVWVKRPARGRKIAEEFVELAAAAAGRGWPQVAKSGSFEVSHNERLGDRQGRNSVGACAVSVQDGLPDVC